MAAWKSGVEKSGRETESGSDMFQPPVREFTKSPDPEADGLCDFLLVEKTDGARSVPGLDERPWF